MRRIIPLFLVLVVASVLRLYNPNWDGGHHLHPDERFLTMVQTAMSLPNSLGEYLDPARSPFNPRNLGHDFFVYGNWPLTINKLLAIALDNDGYDGLRLQGRTVSAVADVLVVALVWAVARLIRKKYQLPDNFELWSAMVYTLLVLPIQLAHFFTTDTFLNLFVWIGLMGAVVSMGRFKAVGVVVAAIGFGMALGSKVSAVYVLPLILGLMTYGYWIRIAENLINFIRHRFYRLDHCEAPAMGGQARMTQVGMGLVKMTGAIIGFGLVSYMTLRLVSPYYFESASWLDLRLSSRLVANIEQLRSWEGDDVWFPPAIQWIARPAIWYSLYNMTVLGMGLPAFVLSVLGLVLSGYLSFRCKRGRGLVVITLVWLVVFFGYQSSQFVKALRYFFFIYPLLALMAGLTITMIMKWVGGFQKANEILSPRRMSGFPSTLAGKQNDTMRVISYMIIVILLLIWPLAFVSIYIRPHTRVAASEWIYQNLPPSQRVLNEHWDDPLPLRLPQYVGLDFNGGQLPVFGQDTDEKWLEMNQMLQNADYYFVTSNRAWGSVMRVTDRYPRQAQFYKDLFAGNLEWVKVAEFTSYPSLRWLGIPWELNDDWMDETFTVYDHPRVMIFVKR